MGDISVFAEGEPPPSLTAFFIEEEEAEEEIHSRATAPFSATRGAVTILPTPARANYLLDCRLHGLIIYYYKLYRVRIPPRWPFLQVFDDADNRLEFKYIMAISQMMRRRHDTSPYFAAAQR